MAWLILSKNNIPNMQEIRHKQKILRLGNFIFENKKDQDQLEESISPNS